MKEVVAKKTRTIVAGSHLRKYPWERWFAQDRFRLVRGRDYQVTTAGMLQQVRNAAAIRYGVNIATRLGADGQSITVVVMNRRGGNPDAKFPSQK